MTADIIQARYDQLDNIANRFSQEAENTTALMQQVQYGVDTLRQSGWEGLGAAAFLGEMETAVFPVIQRLAIAFEEANSAILTVRDIVYRAEEKAANLFQGNTSLEKLAGSLSQGYDGNVIPVANKSDQELLGDSQVKQEPVKVDDSNKSTDLTVDKGQVTFDAEGQDDPDSKLTFSRRPHVPTDGSGITLGRGYDLRDKTPSQVYADLREAGLSHEEATKFSGGVGKKGEEARQYLKDNQLTNHMLTHEQQKKLFEISYKDAEADVKRIVNKNDVVEKYGATDWDKLNPKIKEIIIDLRYRGDYTPETRRLIQQHVANNDLDGVTKALSNRSNWPKVPKDRFERRVRYLNEDI